jgi:3-oxoacyl-[acyl-carrier-protein] synthase II
MSRKRVVVTGLGAVSPIGNTVPECWDNASNGRSGIGSVTRFDTSAFASQIAGEVKDFDPSAVIERKELKKLDLFSQYALVAGQEAWDDAGLQDAISDPTRSGCILGIGIGGLGTLEKYHEAYLNGGPRKISPFLIPGMISNLGPGNLAIRFGLKGMNYTVTSACTSATHALGESCRLISEGIHDVMISGGTESAITPIGVGGFSAMKALSTRNDEPERASRPFDRDRDGFVLAEGATILVLESLEHATARGAKIYGEIIGYGYSCDAYHITSPATDGAGAAACMTMALESAGLNPEDVQCINTHGTSTDAGDIAETKAVKSVFGSYAKEGLLVNSTKSMTGHLLGAAGAIEAMLCLLSLKNGVVLPTINLENPDEQCDLDYVPNESREVSIETVLSNSFGFGGTNATIALKKFSG